MGVRHIIAQTAAIMTALVVALLSTSRAAETPAGGDAPNLVPNGDFERGTNGPAEWDPLPDDGTVRWATDNAEHGKVIHFSLTKAVAEGPGLLWYSGYIPVEHGKTYRLTFDAKSFGPVLRPFIKGYAPFRDAQGAVEARRLYQKQNKCEIGTDWQTISFDFVPQTAYTHQDVQIKWVRVMLYAYLKPGDCYWDNVRITEVASKLPNGDFEEGEGHPAGWAALPDDESVRWENEPHSGKCVVLVPPDGKQATYVSDAARVTTGYTYRFAVDVKARGCTPHVVLDGLVPSKEPDAFDVLTQYTPPDFAGDRNWTTWSFDFTVERPEHLNPSNTVRWVRVRLGASGGPGRIYFDNVRVEPLGRATQSHGKPQW
jgi:hypothetical protein